MNIPVVDHKHAYGHAHSYFVSNKDVLIVDAYDDQYSINWSTRLTPSEFLSIWRHSGMEKARALLMTSSSERLPVERYAYQLFSLIDSRELDHISTTLIRLWFEDASVAWQVLPSVSDKSAMSDSWGAVVGLASYQLDYEGLERYFKATATRPLVKAAGDLLPRAARGLEFREDPLYALRYADFDN